MFQEKLNRTLVCFTSIRSVIYRLENEKNEKHPSIVTKNFH